MKYIKDLPFDPKSTMMTGMDVSHPGSFDHKIAISLAAAVGSCDPGMSSYSCAVQLQSTYQSEIITEAGEMTESLLKYYKERNGQNPSGLIVFRVGASDGQLKQIQEVEVPAIELSLKKVVKFGKVKLCFIIVQKGHNTRFALTQVNSEGVRETFNVASGTVVDSTITDPTVSSFFLNSHFSPLVNFWFLML